MPRTIIIDADVVGQINRGNKNAAATLKGLMEVGVNVHVSRQSYNELTSQPGKAIAGVGPDFPRTAVANRRLLQELGIKVAPAGALADRVAAYEKNAAKGTLSERDLMTAAQARAINAEVWSFDKAFRNDPQGVGKRFGITVATESTTTYMEHLPHKGEDYRTARSLMGLKPVEVTVIGQIVEQTQSGDVQKQTDSATGNSGSGDTNE